MHVNKHSWAKGLTTCLFLSAFVSATQAAGFRELYSEAQANDPQYAAARADRQAAETLIQQAGGQLLPQVSASGSRIKNNLDNDVKLGSSLGTRTTTYDFISKNASLNLNMALFRPQLWLALTQSVAQVRQAEGAVRQAEQDLILRFSQAYFDVLLAEDTVRLAQEQKAAVAERLRQAKRYFEAGVGTITDVNEALARFDVVAAQELAAINILEIRRRALEITVGRFDENIDQLGDRLALDLPSPASSEAWQDFAVANNPQLKVREAALEVAEQEVHKNFAAHLPTVDMVASRSRQENPGYTTIDTTNWTNMFGVQVNIPIFSGGTTQGRVNQASFNRERSRYELEATRRSVTLSIRQEYLNVINGVAQVKANEQAVRSNELALYSAQRGQEAGVRTSFDVLNAQSLLYTAKRDLAQARYAYVLARLKLRSAAGLLGDEDILLVQSWLGNDVATSPADSKKTKTAN